MACRDDPRIAAAKALTEARFPRYWQELQGLAAGLALPFDDVFAWNSRGDVWARSEEHTSELQSLMRISYAVFCLKKQNKHTGAVISLCIKLHITTTHHVIITPE